MERLAKAEERAFASDFLAPIFGGNAVGLRIAGVVCRLKVQPADFERLGCLPADVAGHSGTASGPPGSQSAGNIWICCRFGR